jgi:RNA polymerase sigma factor (sigma-70 family)
MSMPTATSWTLLRKLGTVPADGASWEVFARRYGPAVFQWGRQWGLQEADANDLTQTVLLKLVEHMKVFQYDPAGSFRAWLKTVSFHAWAKSCAVRHKEKERHDEDALASVEAKEDLATRLEREYDQELLDLALVRVSQRVEPHTWEAFRLLALKGQSGAEVARQLNLRVATVHVARSKVQRMIREELALLETAENSQND